MKKNSKNNEPTTEAAPTAQPTTTNEQQPTQAERKPDFYARLLTERPTEAASILATLCRRKDKAIRAMNDAHSSGKEFADCYRIGLSIAFPRNRQTA